jgi:hypothetical protein
MMKLKQAVELQIVHYGSLGNVRVDKNDYFCLNDLQSFYPNRRIDFWLKSQGTQEFVALVERDIIPPNGGIKTPAIVAKRGKGGGTYAQELVAMEFCMWLSPEFKLEVIKAYRNQREIKENWNFKRILAAESVKIQSEAVKEHIVPLHRPENAHWQYTNNVKMINSIVGVESVEAANELQLDQIGYLERKNAFYIEEGMTEQKDRAVKLKEAYQKKYGMKMIAECGA